MARVKVTDPSTGVTVEAEETHPIVALWQKSGTDAKPGGRAKKADAKPPTKK